MFHQATNGVRGHNMDLLDERSLGRRGRKAVLAKRLHRARPGGAGKANGREPALARGLQSRDHVR